MSDADASPPEFPSPEQERAARRVREELVIKSETIGGGSGKPIPVYVGVLVLTAVVAADYGAFRLLDSNYFRWYLAAGPVIALLVTGVAVAVDLETLPDLISTHPGSFLGACFEAMGLSSLSFADMFPHVAPDDDPKAGLHDFIPAALLVFAIAVLWVAWLIVIAPLQYFGNLVAGAPARLALASPRRTWVVRGSDETVVMRTPKDLMPDGAEVVGLARYPVALTSSITAGLLFAISQFS